MHLQTFSRYGYDKLYENISTLKKDEQLLISLLKPLYELLLPYNGKKVLKADETFIKKLHEEFWSIIRVMKYHDNHDNGEYYDHKVRLDGYLSMGITLKGYNTLNGHYVYFRIANIKEGILSLTMDPSKPHYGYVPKFEQDTDEMIAWVKENEGLAKALVEEFQVKMKMKSINTHPFFQFIH